jgi:hypothetical protein
MPFDDFELQNDVENMDVSGFDSASTREIEEINEWTFCDDCGGNNHTWENCPDTKNVVSNEESNPDYLCHTCELDMGDCNCFENLADKLGLDWIYDKAMEDIYEGEDWRGD